MRYINEHLTLKQTQEIASLCPNNDKYIFPAIFKYTLLSLNTQIHLLIFPVKFQHQQAEGVYPFPLFLSSEGHVSLNLGTRFFHFQSDICSNDLGTLDQNYITGEEKCFNLIISIMLESCIIVNLKFHL